MKDTITLITTSTLAAILFLLHWTDEIARGMEKAQVANLPGVAIVVVWLIGSLILGARRSGYIVMLLFGILGFGVLVLHMMGAGLLRGRIANTPGMFFWVFTALLLGVTSALSAILAAKGLWSTFRRR
ncbi:MAG TPA: hypothetical protein VJ840_16870 [Gemmatimonadaceae bacterium]|nr:hypothetical protein [Gemmatimonadaceae bacterium]